MCIKGGCDLNKKFMKMNNSTPNTVEQSSV